MEMQHDDYFRTLGATQVYDEQLPPRGRSYDGAEIPQGQFARYYFNAEGTEIGYVLVCMDQFARPIIHPTPRVWGIPHTLVPL